MVGQLSEAKLAVEIQRCSVGEFGIDDGVFAISGAQPRQGSGQ